MEQNTEDSTSIDFPLQVSQENDVPYSSLNSKKHTMEKHLGLSHGFSLMVGLVLGSGIFISPGLVASGTSSAGMLLVVWTCAGALALMGSLCYCELGCLINSAGGNYANILYLYGDLPAFLCVWTASLVIDPASNSAVALTIGVYFTKPFYETEQEGSVIAKLVAFGVIIIACFINCYSVQLTNRVQRLFAVAQIVSVLFVVSLGIWQLSCDKVDNFHNMFNGTHLEPHSVIHIGVALFGALWSFDGWASINNVIEEFQNVETNLLLTVMTSFPFVLVCYILVNVSFLTVLTHQDMSNAKAVGVDFVRRILGVKVSYLMMTLVGLSSYGTLNGCTFTSPRLTMAAAREGHMPAVFSLINQKSGSPIPATLLLTAMSCIMLIPSASNVSSLILLFSQAQWILYGLSIFGVIVLRLREPNRVRPFKIFIGIPVLMSLVSLFLVIIPFFLTPVSSGFVFVFILCGIPVYLIFVYFRSSLPNCYVSCANGFTMRIQKYFYFVQCSKQA